MDSRRLLGGAVLLVSLDIVLGWHAWLGQEAIPTISGTNLESSLNLPLMSPDIKGCDITLTSLHKIISGRLCLQNQEMCSLACATAWGSLLRDYSDLTGAKCPTLKGKIREWSTSSIHIPTILDSDFDAINNALSDTEQYKLADLCSGSVYKCGDNHCKRLGIGKDGTSSAPKYSSLAPPIEECNSFQIVDGENTVPFLTWNALHHSYMAKATGCAGGLSNITGDAEHTTWACVHQPSCTTDDIPKGDLACFKYSHVRGEFHFWDWNRNLQLMAPLFQVPMSFCDSTPGIEGQMGRLRLVDATTAAPVSVYKTAYHIQEYDAADKLQSKAVSEGSVFNLGADGCSTIQLQGDARVQLAVTMAGYISYLNPFYIPRDGGTLSAALYPIRPSATGAGLGLVLEWCEQPQNLDLWITVPVPAAGGRPFYSCSKDFEKYNAVLGKAETFKTWFDSSNNYHTEALCLQAQGTWELIEAWDDDDNAAVYWDGPKHIVSPCPEQGQPGYDPTCVPAIVTLENNEDQGYGPETLSLTGKLPDGLYRVYAMVYSGHPDSTFQAACGAARLTVYSEMNRQGPLYSYEVGQKTWLDKDGNWWQVFNLQVSQGCVSLLPIDRIVAGYTSVPSRTTVPPSWNGPVTSLSRTSAWSQTLKIYCWNQQKGSFDFMLKLFPHVRSIADDRILQGATYAIFDKGQILVAPGASLDDIEKVGIDLPPGEYEIVVSANMYVDMMTCITMASPGDRLKHQTFWLAPADNSARAVLRWRSTPLALDLYVLPVATGLRWRDDMGVLASCAHVGPQNPVLQQGVSSVRSERSSAAHPTSLMPDSEGEGFGPKSVTISQGGAGQYRVYVQAPPLGNQIPVLEGGVGGTCEEQVFVDIYFDSLYYSTLQFDAGYTKWWYVGYFSIEPAPLNTVSWNPQNYLVSQYDPIDCITSPLISILFSIKSSGAYTPATDFSDITYSVQRVDATAEAACEARTLCSKTCEEMFLHVGVEMCFQTISQLAPTIDSLGGCSAANVPQGFSLSSNGADLCPRICKHEPCSEYRTVSSGVVGPDKVPCTAGSCCLQRDKEDYCIDKNEVWDQQTHNAVNLPAAYYYIVFEKAGYHKQLKTISLSSFVPHMKLDLLMVPVPTDPKEIIVVLTWATNPKDLDLWVITDDGQIATWWDNRGPNDGIRLDTDNGDGVGPEVITFTSTTSPGRYRIAANVYSSNNAFTCEEADGDVCRFQGLETVSFYGSRAPSAGSAGGETFSGLLARSVMPMNVVRAEQQTAYTRGSAHSWWYAATVTRQNNGQSVINTQNQNYDTNCAFLRRAAGGIVCGGDYCCTTCTSNCGRNMCGCGRRSGGSTKLKKKIPQT